MLEDDVSSFIWKGNVIFYSKKVDDKTSFVAYNFEERRLTCIGKVDQRFDDFFLMNPSNTKMQCIL